MPREEAERLICQSAGQLCVRMTRAADGHLVTLDYRPPAEEPRQSWRATALISFVLALVSSAVGALLFGQGRIPGSTRVLGALRCPTPTAGPVAPGVYPAPAGTSTPQADADFEI
jgi:hypothetical protein